MMTGIDKDFCENLTIIRWFKIIPPKNGQEIFGNGGSNGKGMNKKPARFKVLVSLLIKVVTIKLKFKMVKTIANEIA